MHLARGCFDSSVGDGHSSEHLKRHIVGQRAHISAECGVLQSVIYLLGHGRGDMACKWPEDRLLLRGRYVNHGALWNNGDHQSVRALVGGTHRLTRD